MQLNLAFLNLPEPPSSPVPTNPPQAAWEQLDEAARIAALGVLVCIPAAPIPLLGRQRVRDTGSAERAVVLLGGAVLCAERSRQGG